MLYEIEGKVIIKKGDPIPFRCPDCKRIIDGKATKYGNAECPWCHYRGKRDEFSRTEFVFLCDARVLAPVG